MDYRKKFQEERESVKERYALISERVSEIVKEEVLKEPYRDYFVRTGQFLCMLMDMEQEISRGEWENRSLSDWQEQNRRLYEDILPEHYEKSYGNPDYVVKKLGRRLGQLLSCFYTELRGGIAYVTEGRLSEFVAGLETFVELYNIFEEPEGGDGLERRVWEALYYFFSDYCDVTMDFRVMEQLDPSMSFARDVVMEAGKRELSYLYHYGEYVGESTLKTARYIESLDEKTISAMARNFTEGYRRGFVISGKDLGKKKQVEIRYTVGFERVIKEAICQFHQMGLEATICRPAVNLMSKNPAARIGYVSQPANPQFDYDHRYDMGLFLDKALKERRLGVLRHSLDMRKELAGQMGGPALMETFGEELFEPKNKPEAVVFSEKQKELYAGMQAEAAGITNEYIKGEERSFTIVSYPVPEIGSDFEAIFQETVALNNLDVDVYEKVQQKLIDALDGCRQVRILGKDGNRTDLVVELKALSHPEKETLFENCLADVNIPLGEVFTSPKLSGTNGLLHVKEVYIDGLRFENLEIGVKDGMTDQFSCTNFPSEQENRELVEGNILFHHGSLPMGEFAIGTNTKAYAMAKKYHIFQKLKILIAEKTGPHFAFGDTCYSRAEELPVYNPDGKEVIARDNEVSRLRLTEPEKAYFGCHTDITLPFDELGEMTGIGRDGTEISIIRDGRFVLPGTELLNKALEAFAYEEEKR